MSRIGRKTVVLHVGAHKTGTSLLQKYMRDNVRTLRRHRICYLSRGSMNDYIGWGGKLLQDPEPLARKIHQILRIPWFNLLIASHENTLGRPLPKDAKDNQHLYPRAHEVIDGLADLLRPYRPKIFLSIRPQEQFLESYYLQSVHEGRYKSFEEWLEGIDLDAVSWLPIADKLFDSFGREQVEIVDFRLIKHGQEAYIQHFFTQINPRYSFKFEYPPRRNPSISDKGLRMALAANPHLKSGQERKLMRNFLQKNFSNVQYPRPVLFSDEQRRWLEDRYAAEYEKLVSGGPRVGDGDGTPDVAAR